MTPLEGISGPGDSGGPALIETADGLRVAGLSVASSGRPKGRYGALEFYSRVSPQVTWIREITMPAGAVEPVVTPVAVASTDVEPVETPVSLPAVEADSIATPNPVPALEAGAEATSGSETAVYAAVAALGGLALVTFAWWFHRRRPSVSA